MDFNKEIELLENFRKLYARTNKPPQRRKTGWLDIIVLVGLLVVTVASLVVSAAHTIPTFLDTLGDNDVNKYVPIATFMMVEFGIIFFTFVKTRDKFLRRERHDINVGYRTLFMIIYLVAVGSGINLRSVLLNEGIFVYRIANIILFSFVGISAPLVAYITGDLLAFFVVQNDVEYQEKYRDWESAMKRSWDSRKGKLIKPETSVITQEPVTKVVARHGKAKAEAERYFDENPERVIDGTLDELAQEAKAAGYNTGRGTLFKVRKERQ